MDYIVCQEPGRFELKEKAPPSISSGEALVRIHRVGICGTDLHAYSGNQAFFTYPRVLGHELAGEVLELGSGVSNVAVGDRVIIMPYLHCGTCIACRRGKTNCCARMQVLGVHVDGGMQQEIAVRADLLLPSNERSYTEMAIVEPLAIGAHAIRRANLEAGETIVVVGCGPIGIGLLKLAQLAGSRVIAVDVNADRLAFVSNQLGIEHTVLATDQPISQVEQITKGDLATAVFDATGNRRALESGIQYMAHGGRYVLVGLSKGDLMFQHPAIHAKETSLLCSRNATLADFQFVINQIEQFPTEAFVTHRVSYHQMIDHFDTWLQPESQTIKAMVDFSN